MELASMEFSFKYCIDPKDHKSKEEIKVIVSESAIGPMLLPDPMQNGGVPTEHKNVAALFVDNAFKPLIIWKCM